MATIYKRPGSKNWQIEFTAPNGKRIQKSTGTVDENAARQYAAHFENESWKQARLGEKTVRTWQEAVTEWVKLNQDKRSIKEDIKSLRWLHTHLHGIALDQIDRSLIETIKADKLKT